MSSSSYPTASVYEEKLSQSYNKPPWKPSPKSQHSSALVNTPCKHCLLLSDASSSNNFSFAFDLYLFQKGQLYLFLEEEIKRQKMKYTV